MESTSKSLRDAAVAALGADECRPPPELEGPDGGVTARELARVVLRSVNQWPERLTHGQYRAIAAHATHNILYGGDKLSEVAFSQYARLAELAEHDRERAMRLAAEYVRAQAAQAGEGGAQATFTAEQLAAALAAIGKLRKPKTLRQRRAETKGASAKK